MAGNSFTGTITLSKGGQRRPVLTNSIATSLAAPTVGQNLTISSGVAPSPRTGVLTVNLGTLTTNSVGGTNLEDTSTNVVTNFNATNATSAISLTNNSTLTAHGHRPGTQHLPPAPT